MQKIIAIAAEYQHLINFCKAKNIMPDRFVYATSIEKMLGLARGYKYIWVTDPREYEFRQKLREQFRIKDAIRLPLDINEWSLMDFV